LQIVSFGYGCTPLLLVIGMAPFFKPAHARLSHLRLAANQRSYFVLSLFGIAILATVAVLLLQLDSIVHLDLYNYGLQFSEKWATSYWIYMRLSLTIIGIVIIANCSFLLHLLLHRHAPAQPLQPTAVVKKSNWLEKKGESVFRGRKALVLLTIFIILMLISLATAYVFHQSPTEETITSTLCTYTNAATYDYTAILETPNAIYDNKTTLKPNEGTLFARITKQINITLVYNFYATLQVEPNITYSLTQTLLTAAWQHEITSTITKTTNQTNIPIPIPQIDKDLLQEQKAKIESETGTSTSTYSVKITPSFTIDANTTAGEIHETFTPTLTVSFEHTEQGDVILIEDLYQAESGQIIENQIITHHDNINKRYASYALTTISIIGLCFSTYFYKKAKPTTEETPVNKLLSPYKDLIIKAQELPETHQDATIINLEDIQEIAKMAEILAKPIILTKEPTLTLTIIDRDTIYQYTHKQGPDRQTKKQDKPAT
jgi:hypothetical protein